MVNLYTYRYHLIFLWDQTVVKNRERERRLSNACTEEMVDNLIKMLRILMAGGLV